MSLPTSPRALQDDWLSCLVLCRPQDDAEIPGGKRFTPEHLYDMVQGPFDQGPVMYPSGTWRRMNLEGSGVMEMTSDIGDKNADLQTAYHGANLAALNSIWSGWGIYSLKAGPSSADNVFGVYCEGQYRLLRSLRGPYVIRRWF